MTQSCNEAVSHQYFFLIDKKTTTILHKSSRDSICQYSSHLAYIYIYLTIDQLTSIYKDYSQYLIDVCLYIYESLFHTNEVT